MELAWETKRGRCRKIRTACAASRARGQISAMDTPASDFVRTGSLAEPQGQGAACLLAGGGGELLHKTGSKMKASLFCAARYLGAAPHDIWPLSGKHYSGEAAVRSMQTTFDQFRCADEFGFDWVTVAEHHYSGFSLTPTRWSWRER